jgi:hypothetical protein
MGTHTKTIVTLSYIQKFTEIIAENPPISGANPQVAQEGAF